MNDPKEYNTGLNWLLPDGDFFLLGFTQEALDQAGSFSSLELAESDDEMEENDWVGELPGKEAVVPLYAPFALRIVEVNPDVQGQPSMLLDDPTGDAWVFRVEKC